MTIQAAALVISVSLSHAAGAQTATGSVPPLVEEFPRGEVVAVVETMQDPDFTYALYLPDRYSADREWPVLYVLDPRGRALIALELFRDAAERNGFIVVSSYQSRSDTNVPVTASAFQALLNDIPLRFAYDPRRLVVAGMSGTAHAAWGFAQVLDGRLQGIIACAGGVQTQTYGPLEGEVPFAYYGITMTDDFNYQEMMRLAGHLDEVGSPRHFEVVDGRHGWPDRSATERALDWMTLQFTLSGFPPPQAGFVENQWKLRRDHAGDRDDPLERLRHFQSLQRDFADRSLSAADQAELEQLASSGEVAAARKLEKKLAAREQSYLSTRLADWQRALLGADDPPDVAHSAVLLHLARIQKQAEAPDAQRAASARRLLENMYTVASFYLPRSLEERGDIGRAETSLRLAARVFPDRGWTYWQLANLQLDAGRHERAAENLLHAAQLGAISPEILDQPRWQALSESKSWLQVEAAVAGLAAGSTSDTGD